MAFICMDAGVPVFGHKGCSVHVQEVVRGLLRHGADVTLYAAREGAHRPADLAAVGLRALPALRDGSAAARERAALAANERLDRALTAEGPFDLVYERYSLWSFAGMEYAHRTGTAGLLEVNAPLIPEQSTTRALVDEAGAAAVAGRVFGAAQALLAVSTGVGTYLNGFPPARGKVHVLPNAVDPRRVHPAVRPARPALPPAFTVGFVGTLKPWHGLSTLVEGFAGLRRRAPASRLLIVGEGPERDRLTREAREHGVLEAVELTGSVPPADVPAWLTSMDVAVAPAPPLSDFYFSPLKIFEYMAAARPVVAAGIGQIAELVEHEVNGLLYAPGDAVGLAAALERLRADMELRVRLGTAARETILRRHTWDHTIGRILRLAGVRTTAA